MELRHLRLSVILVAVGLFPSVGSSWSLCMQSHMQLPAPKPPALARRALGCLDLGGITPSCCVFDYSLSEARFLTL